MPVGSKAAGVFGPRPPLHGIAGALLVTGPGVHWRPARLLPALAGFYSHGHVSVKAAPAATQRVGSCLGGSQRGPSRPPSGSRSRELRAAAALRQAASPVPTTQLPVHARGQHAAATLRTFRTLRCESQAHVGQNMNLISSNSGDDKSERCPPGPLLRHRPCSTSSITNHWAFPTATGT